MITPLLDPGPLEITTNEPQEVHVKLFPIEGEQGKYIPGFAYRDGGTYYSGGLHWQIQKGDTIHDQYAMFVTFILSPEIKKLEGDFWYSPVYEQRHGHESGEQDGHTHHRRRAMMCIPYATWKAGCHFGVKHVHDHQVIDPEIVITPIGGHQP
jgi:hypothetical protein